MTTSSERLLTLKARLAAAELAEFQLATGSKKVTLSVAMPGTGTQMTTFNAASLSDLLAYIVRLKGEIADLSGDADGAPRAIHWA